MRVGKQRVMRGVGAVHGDDFGQAAYPVGAVPIGRDTYSTGRVDVIGRVAAIGDRNLVRGIGGLAQADRRRARVSLRDRKALAAGDILGPGGRHQPTQHGTNGIRQPQHRITPFSIKRAILVSRRSAPKFQARKIPSRWVTRSEEE